MAGFDGSTGPTDIRDGLVRTEELTTGDTEEELVADLTSGAGDGDMQR